MSSRVVRSRFHGRIAGVGTTSGTRLVVGHWRRTPLGPFSDVMLESAAGHRVLLAPSDAVVGVVEATYVFDEVRREPVEVDTGPGPDGERWRVTSPSLELTFDVGGRAALGVLLRLVPEALATSPRWAEVVDPVARVVLRGVRTRGVARPGRREWYGATDLHRVRSAYGRFDGQDLGALAPVDPPCRFGFSSTPRTPSVTSVVTTIEEG
ncbi:hypothetical protein [Lapillicoccus jejuensis]|uniref:Uncharacterized protein n=1 Tax=Lapillicoccus jejuensis TaxID=402171 RepID=A0A542E6K5_9MICO|nr:hypothetical protein [Lapillicoccus jejuensis]TQJ10896.1 hypothetical protein FB458_4039 [Lapillicoccus jejuensis]